MFPPGINYIHVGIDTSISRGIAIKGMQLIV